MNSIKLEHGAGGKQMQNFIRNYILKYFDNDCGEVPLKALDDSAVIHNIIFTTDSHTVKPIFFSGGDIGSLAVAGTINDIAVLGGKPIALSCALIIEEGFSGNDLQKILQSMQKTSKLANVPIITGDTKVVERNSLSEIIINTAGIGVAAEHLKYNSDVVNKYRNFNSKWLLDSNLSPGDKLIVSGNIAEHGIAILSAREGYGFETTIYSDITPLNHAIEKILAVGGVVCMKDPTRGGLSAALNEFSQKSHVGIVIEESQIPINDAVRNACEMLGIESLDIGNEGKIVIGVVKEKADEILGVMHEIPECKNAKIIGEATKAVNCVVMKTEIGGKRIVDMPIADPIPRIC